LPYSFVRDILLRNNVRIARAIIAISEERRWETPMRDGEIKGGRGGEGERERERDALRRNRESCTILSLLFFYDTRVTSFVLR